MKLTTIPLITSLLAVLACASAAPAARGGNTRVGPARGALVVAGGGALGPEIMQRFVALAGGPDRANIVVIPTAGDPDEYPADWPGLNQFRSLGVKKVALLHTRDHGVANQEAFSAALRDATGVWMPGGRQWRLADSYLGTRTLKEINQVLARGGVVGGTSAGASIQASYMVRGARSGNAIMMAPGYEDGFGFLRNTAVDQHLTQRQREKDMLAVVERHPKLLGIGLDESTAIVVRGDTAEVVGRNRVAVYNTDPANRENYFFITPGSRFDLNRRVLLK